MNEIGNEAFMDVLHWFDRLANWFRSLFSSKNEPVNRNVLVITFAPRIPSLGNLPLHEAMAGWNNPDTLVRQLIDDMRDSSNGYANFNVVEQVVSTDFTPMSSGEHYTPDLYLSAMADHQAKIEDRADYAAILNQYDVVNKIHNGMIDEVWLMGYPFAGFNESRMGGPGAFFCNGDPLPGTEQAGRRFIVMGFNYERGVGEMLESIAHRAEFILDKLFAGKTGEVNLYERFTRIDWDHPGQAEVGTVHHGPNAILTPDRDDHQWTETRTVPSRHKTWYQYPDLSGAPEPTNCDAWREADMTRGHHKWWFRHFPHVEGQTNGIANNWWKYILDPDLIWP